MRFVVETMIAEEFPEAQTLGMENGQLAPAAFEQVRADLVICDQFMPIMNGTTLAHRLRFLQPMLPIIMVSGSPEARALGVAAGISVFTDKDQVTRELIKQIKLLLADQVESVT